MTTKKYNKNKRPGSGNPRKIMTAKQKLRRNKIYLYERRLQSNIKRVKVERQQCREYGGDQS